MAQGGATTSSSGSSDEADTTAYLADSWIFADPLPAAQAPVEEPAEQEPVDEPIQEPGLGDPAELVDEPLEETGLGDRSSPAVGASPVVSASPIMTSMQFLALLWNEALAKQIDDFVWILGSAAVRRIVKPARIPAFLG